MLQEMLRTNGSAARRGKKLVFSCERNTLSPMFCFLEHFSQGRADGDGDVHHAALEMDGFFSGPRSCFSRVCTLSGNVSISDGDFCTFSALRSVVGPLIPHALWSCLEATSSDPARSAWARHRIRKPSQDSSFSFPFPRVPHSRLICVHRSSHPQLRRSLSETAVFFCMFSLLSACCWYIACSLQASWSVAC